MIGRGRTFGAAVILAGGGSDGYRERGGGP